MIYIVMVTANYDLIADLLDKEYATMYEVLPIASIFLAMPQSSSRLGLMPCSCSSANFCLHLSITNINH